VRLHSWNLAKPRFQQPPPQGLIPELAIEIAHKSSNHLLADGKSPKGVAAGYIYFAAMLLGVNLSLSSHPDITEFKIRSS
jgi:transcription initiation factor TFIIB